MNISTIALLSLAGSVFGHPGHEEPEHELISKRPYNVQARRGLSACAEHLEKRGHNARSKARRAATAEKHRRSLRVRDTDAVLNTSPASNQSFTPWTDPEALFEKSATCVLAPEREIGPYWVKGEYVRNNLREDQPGVPIVLEGQFIDIETCEPLPNIWWDLWNCNATGVYGGVVEEGNGNSADLSIINATFLRGVQKSDADGTVTFASVFPGHYAQRATHHHMVVLLNATLLANGTLSGGTYAHIGQFFWDQDLITKVEASWPYNTNNITVTLNSEDRVFGVETADTTSDPVCEYTYLGDDLFDGLFGWVTVGVNTSASYTASYIFTYTENGGTY